jgi:hypothetical protein
VSCDNLNQISKVVVGEKRQLLKRLPKFMYDEEKDLEVISIPFFYSPKFVALLYLTYSLYLTVVCITSYEIYGLIK